MLRKMTDIFPFIGTRYNSRLIEDMKQVISPWYEMIPAEKQKEYRQRHPYNILHLIPTFKGVANEEYNDSYLRTASLIQTWRRDGILVNDNNKSFYLYEQTYAHPLGKSSEIRRSSNVGGKVRRGIYALINLNRQPSCRMRVEGSTPNLGGAFHLKLLRATRCNFSPIPMFFHDPQGEFVNTCEEVTPARAWEEIVDTNNDTHRLWVINKKDPIARIGDFFRKKDCFIIEGHKRFEVSLTYRDEQRETTGRPDGLQPFDYTLVFLSSFEEGSVSTMPVHRVLSAELGSGVDLQEVLEDLALYFTVTPVKVNLKKPDTAAEKILSILTEKGKKHHAIGMAFPDGRAFILTLKSNAKIPELYDEETNLHDAAKQLDVSILSHYIIRQCWIGNPEIDLEEEDILYFEDAAAALKHTVEKKASAAFLLNPCPMKQLTEVVTSGGEVPPFAVRLHPPLISGLIIRDMSVRH